MNAVVRIPVVLDRVAFVGLCVALPDGEIMELVQLFVCETDFYMAEIASRRAEGDLESVARLARNIVSIAGNLGAMRAQAVARQLERVCRSGSKANSYHLISVLSQACRDASDVMDVLLKKDCAELHTA